MKYTLSLLFALSLMFSVLGQQTIWTENFENNPTASWTLNTTSLSSTGTAGENLWVINNEYNGPTTPIVIPNTPNQPAGFTNAPQSQYLHITSKGAQVAGEPENAHHTFLTAPAATEQYFVEMSSGINTSNYIAVQIKFWYLNEAEGAGGNSGQLYYSTNGGAAWIAVGPNYAGVSTWTVDSVSNGAFDNQNDLRFGFLFDNPATGANAPTLSIDEIVVSGTPSGVPIVDFVASDTTICAGTCINFTDMSQLFPTSWNWNLPGGTPSTDTAQNPSNICYNTAGLWNVTLTAQNSLGAPGGTLTKTGYIEVIDCTTPPSADFIVDKRTICAGDTVSFTDLSSGNPDGWTWFFVGADSANSTRQNPTNIRYSTPGTFEVTLIATNPGGTDVETKRGYIRVQDCVQPIPVFTTASDSICIGDCITISYDVDSGNIEKVNTFDWEFDGIDKSKLDPNVHPDTNNPIFSKAEHTVCYNKEGRYRVRLLVSNQFGTQVKEEFNYINVGLPPTVKVLDTNWYCVYKGNDVYVRGQGDGDQYAWGYLVDGVFRFESPIGVPEKDTNFVEIYDWTSKETDIRTHGSRWFYLLNINDYGCRSFDSLYIQVKNEFFIGVPDIFSPNADGRNDRLTVQGNGIAKIKFSIYSRYGVKIWETENIEEATVTGWDGTVNENPVNPGVFVYVAEVTMLDGTFEEMSGNVTLVR